MITRRVLFPFALVVAAGVSLTAQASPQPFSQAAFDAAQAQGKSILVDVKAPWCPVCKAQSPIISKLIKEKKYSSVIVFEVDFDSMKDVLRKLKVQRQSTLIAFKGAKETMRSTGDTNPMSIEDLIETSL